MKIHDRFDLLNDPVPTEGFWVFGYGSLIWDPGFAFEAKRVTRILGYHRKFCLRSTRYRGTDEVPGLVLGLAAGGFCEGVAFQVSAKEGQHALAYLHEREMLRYSYFPTWLEGQCPETQASFPVLGFVVDASNASYAPDLTPEETSRIIDTATGSRGPNRDYLVETVKALQAHKIEDKGLEALLDLVIGRGKNPS